MEEAVSINRRIKRMKVEDLLKTAIEFEEKGSKVYRDLSIQFTGTVKEMLLKLSEEELEHKKRIEQILCCEGIEYNEIEDVKVPGNSPIFNFPLYEIKNIKDVIENAIEMEKNSIEFYTELYIEVKNEMFKKAVLKLTEEEQMHLKELRDIVEDM